jgi:hypothetical protein
MRGEVPPPYTIQTIVLLLFTSSIFEGYFVLLLKYVLLPVLFTLTQVVLLLITSTLLLIISRGLENPGKSVLLEYYLDY